MGTPEKDNETLSGAEDDGSKVQEGKKSNLGTNEQKDDAPGGSRNGPPPVDEDSDDDSDDEDGGHLLEENAGTGAASDSQQTMKREKRLAMNRASARERRRRKRVLLEKLEERVLELTKQVQTLQDNNEGLQSHVRKVEAELANSRAIIATYSAATTRAATGAGASSVGRGASLDAAASLSNMDQEVRLQSLLLGAKSSGFPSEFGGSAPPAGTLNDILAERQILLDLQAHQRRRNLLQQANAASSALAGTAGLGARGSLGTAGRSVRGAAGSALPLLGRMNYLNALTENTVSKIAATNATQNCCTMSSTMGAAMRATMILLPDTDFFLRSYNSWRPVRRGAT